MFTKLSRRAVHALATILRFQSGVYAADEALSVSPRMWNVLIAAGAVKSERRTVTFTIRRDKGRFHDVTEAGEAILAAAGYRTLTADGWNAAPHVTDTLPAESERRAARIANVMSDWKGKEIVLPSGRIVTVGEHRHGTVRLIRTTGPNAGDSAWYPAEEIWQGLEDGTILTPDQLTATLPAAVVEIGQSCRVGTELDAAVELVAADTEWANVTRQAGFAESCVFAAARRYAEAGGDAFTAERATDAAVMVLVHRAYEACKAAGISAARAVELARDIRAARRAARRNRGTAETTEPLNDVAAELERRHPAQYVTVTDEQGVIWHLTDADSQPVAAGEYTAKDGDRFTIAARPEAYFGLSVNEAPRTVDITWQTIAGKPRSKRQSGVFGAYVDMIVDGWDWTPEFP